MNEAMIRECKLHGYTGFQFDFENVEWTRSRRLIGAGKNSADALHKAGLQLSIATVPNAPGYPGARRLRQVDLHRLARRLRHRGDLAKSVDLVCLMTYDQNTRWTMPGPVAGWQWTVDNLDYALQVVPERKALARHSALRLSLVHGRAHHNEQRERRTRSRIRTADYISAVDALQLAARLERQDPVGRRRSHAHSSTSIATRCANGFSIPICTHSRIATNWYRAMGSRVFAPGCSAKKIRRSGRTSRSDNHRRRIADERDR